MSKKIAAFDIDGTLFRWQLYHELAFELKKRGVFDTETAQRFDTILTSWKKRSISWHEYEQELFGKFESHLANITPDELKDAAAAVLTKSSDKVYRYTQQLAHSLKADGYKLIAITASHQEIAEPFALQHGFDVCIGRQSEEIDGAYTGTISRDTYGQKAALLEQYAAEHDLTFAGSVAVGDSASDISMLEIVEHPIAFNPNDELFAHASEKNWEIVIERKNIAYTLQKDTDGPYLLAKTDSF